MAISRPTRRWCWPRPTGQNPRALAETIAASAAQPIRMSPRPRWPGPGFVNLGLATGYWHAAACRHPRCRPGLRPLDDRRRAARSMSNMSRPIRPGRCMSAIAAARSSAMRWPTCWPSPATRSPRNIYINDAGAQIDVLARSVMLRYREALGETDRRDPGRALSRRLSRAGRRRRWPRNSAGGLLRDAGGRGDRHRQGAHHRGHDGDDPRGSGAAQRASRGVLLRAHAACRQRQGRSARRSPT